MRKSILALQLQPSPLDEPERWPRPGAPHIGFHHTA
jgi:hypothetical protein